MIENLIAAYLITFHKAIFLHFRKTITRNRENIGDAKSCLSIGKDYINELVISI